MTYKNTRLPQIFSSVMQSGIFFIKRQSVGVSYRYILKNSQNTTFYYTSKHMSFFAALKELLLNSYEEEHMALTTLTTSNSFNSYEEVHLALIPLTTSNSFNSYEERHLALTPLTTLTPLTPRN